MLTILYESAECPCCGGTGKKTVYGYGFLTCMNCGGKGHVKTQYTVVNPHLTSK